MCASPAGIYKKPFAILDRHIHGRPQGIAEPGQSPGAKFQWHSYLVVEIRLATFGNTYFQHLETSRPTNTTAFNVDHARFRKVILLQ
jgi:hypothetical protein